MDGSSRYAVEVPLPAWDPRTRSITYCVFRTPGVTQPQTFKRYLWKQSDRWDYLAAKHLGDARLWPRILDYNPSIQDPFYVEPGTVIVIPTVDVVS